MAKKKAHKSSPAHLFTRVSVGACPSSLEVNSSHELHIPSSPQRSSSFATLGLENVALEITPASAVRTAKCTANQKNANKNQKAVATVRSTYRSHNSRAFYPANRCIVGEGKNPSHTSARSAESTYISGGREEVRRISPSASSPTVLWRTLLTGDSRLRGKRFSPFWIAETDPRNFLS